MTADATATPATELAPTPEAMAAAEAMPGTDQTSATEPKAIDHGDLVVENLEMHFPITRGLLKKQVGEIKAVDGVSFTLRRGETLGLVGESGCGKTTVGRCISRVYTPTGGHIWFGGKDIATMPEKEFRPLRRRDSPLYSRTPTARWILGRRPGASWASRSRSTRWFRARPNTTRRWKACS